MPQPNFGSNDSTPISDIIINKKKKKRKKKY